MDWKDVDPACLAFVAAFVCLMLGALGCLLAWVLHPWIKGRSKKTKKCPHARTYENAGTLCCREEKPWNSPFTALVTDIYGPCNEEECEYFRKLNK